MNSTKIKCFISVGQTHNFSKTAKELFLTQPSVSKNIHNLENEIATKLVINKNRTITLTPAGQYFYNQINELNYKLNEIINNTQKFQIDFEHTITIGYSGIPFEQKYLPVFIERMNKKHQWHIKLKRVSLAREKVNEQLDNSKIDFMLYQYDFFDNTRYDFFPIFKAGFSVIIRNDDPLIKEKKVTISQLKNRNIYLWDGKTPLKSISTLKRNIIKRLNINLNSIKIINQASLARIIVSSKTGTAIVPSFVYDYENEDLSYKLLDYNPTITYGIGYLNSQKNKDYYNNVVKEMSNSINLIRKKWK